MGTSVALAFSRHSCCCHGCIPNLKENINYQHIDNWLHIQVINVSFHFLQARNLYKQTGAKVSLSISSESGKQYVYNSHPTAQRAIKLQVGTPNPSLQKAPNTWPSRSTLPTLDSTHSPTRKTTVPRIMNIPGKKSATATAPSSNLCNKCVGCGIYFQSAEDMKEKRKYKKQNEWVGCDEEDCNVWGHARCIGIKIPKGKTAADVPYKCSTQQRNLDFTSMK